MNRYLKEALVFVLVVIVMGSFFIIPGKTEAKEKVVAIGDYSPITNLDPASSSVASSILMFRNIFQGLLRYRFNSSGIEGDLAESWSVSKDGLVYTFKLRDNIKWHKEFGKVTAHDVKFSFDRVMDLKTNSVYMGEVTQTVKEVKVIDDLTVEIRLKNRHAAFLHNCTRPKPVAIVSQKAVEKYGKDFGRNPIGSGPFVFQSMSREEIVLTANKEYYEGPPKIDKVIYKTIPDFDTQIMALQRGDIDLLWNLAREQAVLDRLKAAGCKINLINYGAWQQLLINPRVEPLGDIRVRRAIAHAIDKDTIITHSLSGTAERLESLVPKGFFGHTEEGLRRYNFDLKKAKELLVEAGFPNGFEVTLAIPNSPNYVPVAITMQDQLAKVGIKVNLDIMDLPTFFKKVTSGNATMCLYVVTRSPDADYPLTNFFHSAGFSPGVNLARYNQLDREIDEARKELDETKRLKIYHEIQKKLMEDLPSIPLFMMHFPTACRPYIAGFPDRDPLWAIYFYPIHFVEEK